MRLRPKVRRLLCALLLAAMACTPPFTNSKGPIDRADLPLRITHVRGHVFVVEDFCYWKTNSVLYAHPDGIVFIDATWSESTARQLIWKAAVESAGEYAGVVVTSHELHHTGGLRQFRLERVPIYVSYQTAKLLRERWEPMQEHMTSSFGSWRRTPLPIMDHFFEDTLNLVGDRVRVSKPGPGHTPDNLVVFFPEERILYAGSALSVPVFYTPLYDPAAVQSLTDSVRALKPDIVIAGHGAPLRTADFLDEVRRNAAF